ncbi:IS5 family transposase [Kitasatospora purpeofusca]|uniref:IS5 family transposase n=1 Tax=Kitasatospora purpeofusca TaxID=67352 RepID=UPI0036B36438
MGSGRWGWIVPEGPWEVARPLLPAAQVRPQGGVTANIDDEAVFAAIVYVLTSGCAWRHLPPCFGASKSTTHRQFLTWSRAGLWASLHDAVLAELADQGLLDLSRVVLGSAHVRAKKGGELAGPSPVDWGKPGRKMQVLSDRAGLLLVVGVSVGNTHDGKGLKPMVTGFLTKSEAALGGPRRPGKLHADKAYDRSDLRGWLLSQRIEPRIARKGIKSSERLGRPRWVIERTTSWLTGYRPLSLRYERDPHNYLGFLGLATVLTCYKRLLQLTTQDTL